MRKRKLNRRKNEKLRNYVKSNPKNRGRQWTSKGLNVLRVWGQGKLGKYSSAIRVSKIDINRWL